MVLSAACKRCYSSSFGNMRGADFRLVYWVVPIIIFDSQIVILLENGIFCQNWCICNSKVVRQELTSSAALKIVVTVRIVKLVILILENVMLMGVRFLVLNCLCVVVSYWNKIPLWVSIVDVSTIILYHKTFKTI